MFSLNAHECIPIIIKWTLPEFDRFIIRQKLSELQLEKSSRTLINQRQFMRYQLWFYINKTQKGERRVISGEREKLFVYYDLSLILSRQLKSINCTNWRQLSRSNNLRVISTR